MLKMKKFPLLLTIIILLPRGGYAYVEPASHYGRKSTYGSFDCPGTGDPGFYPESEECSQLYYYCDEDGIPYQQLCPGTAVFDPVIDQCTDFETACCNPSITCTTVQEVTTEASFTCPNEGFFPTTTVGCSQYYYYCEEFNQTPFLLFCPGTAVFDPSEATCTDPETACCNPSVVCTTTTSSTTVIDSTSTTSSTAMPDSTTELITASTTTDTSTTDIATTGLTTEMATSTTTHSGTTGAPGEFTCPTPNGNYPYEGDCTKFWACSNGIPYLMVCPAPLVFNPKKGVCDYVQNVPECQ